MHLLSFFYKWFTRCIRNRILPFVSDQIPQQQRGFIDGGSCAQALLALLTAAQRETREFGHLFACFIDIRKAFPRVRREILFMKMARLGIPTIYIKCLSALYTDIQGSVRSSAGFCAPFRISQRTREGCIMSPLLFVIFFSDVISELEQVQLEAGTVMLGATCFICYTVCRRSRSFGTHHEGFTTTYERVCKNL